MIKATSDELLPVVRELLNMKYSDGKSLKLIKILLGEKDSKKFVIKVDDNIPIIINLRPLEYSIEIKENFEKFDILIEITLYDIIMLSMGKIPIKSFLTGKLKLKGKLLDKILIPLLLNINIPDRKTANVIFRHYFLEE